MDLGAELTVVPSGLFRCELDKVKLGPSTSKSNNQRILYNFQELNVVITREIFEL